MAGSSEDSRVAERGCCEKGFRVLFGVVNTLLIFLGIAVFGYSLYLIHEVREKEKSSEESAVEIAKKYWFVEATIAFGLWVVLSSALALLATRLDKVCCLASHVIFVVLALLAEATVVLVSYFNKGWDLDHLAPLDKTGTYKELREVIQEHMKVSLYLGLTVVILQTLSVMLACVVWGYYTGVDEDEDEEEHEIWRRRPLMSDNSRDTRDRSINEDSGRKKDDPWSNRMKEKYGMDMSKFTYDPERAASRGVAR